MSRFVRNILAVALILFASAVSSAAICDRSLSRWPALASCNIVGQSVASQFVISKTTASKKEGMSAAFLTEMTVNDMYKAFEEEDLISREKLKLTTQQKVELFKSGFEKTASFVMMITGAVQMGMQSAPRVPRLRQKPPINYKKPVVTKIEAKPVAAGDVAPRGGPSRIMGNADFGRQLPVRRGGPTHGFLDVGADDLVQLRSGGQLPPSVSSDLLVGLSDDAAIAATHVEGRAAMLMRSNNIPTASLEINYMGGPCKYCRGTSVSSGIQEILLPRQRLDVSFPLPNGNTGHGYFVGGPDGGFVNLLPDF